MNCPSCHRFVTLKDLVMQGGAVERVEGLCQKYGPVLITDWSWEDLFGEEDLPAHD